MDFGEIPQESGYCLSGHEAYWYFRTACFLLRVAGGDLIVLGQYYSNRAAVYSGEQQDEDYLTWLLGRFPHWIETSKPKT